ncbi:uncharacterized protein Tco025E_05235 [Trypanosoma conorhini]|uniref:Uncharacterized protein n=1 Tax=Trypanosoma conorhini TaxID=83891 RepID=A0A3R7NBT9_9TRYP|nr:uncharacterized protein Tco025E_05235 [Trypanosoma conorhini]RNF16254.1 hypothetical protein Tco025E_05235 [Trypanosoma conorhini]
MPEGGLLSAAPAPPAELGERACEGANRHGDAAAPERKTPWEWTTGPAAGLSPHGGAEEEEQGTPRLAAAPPSEEAAFRLGGVGGVPPSQAAVNKMATESSDATARTQAKNSLLPLVEDARVRGEFVSFLHRKFEEAYSLALEQARQHHLRACSEPSGELLAFRRAQQTTHQEELAQLRQKLETEFQEERRQQRHRAYERWVQVLLTRKREKETEYKRALEHYYTHREGERPAPRIFSARDGATRTHFGSDEEAALRTPAAAMAEDQVVCLRRVLRRLQQEMKKASEHAQRCLLQREVSVSAAKARVQQRYLGLIAEQQNELKMLHYWYREIHRLELDAEERIAEWEEQRRRRQRHLQSEEGNQLLSSTSGGGGNDAGKGGAAVTAGSPVLFRGGLFDFLL